MFSHTPKTTPRKVYLTSRPEPYSKLEIEEAANGLSVAGWIKDLHQEPYSRGAFLGLVATRGRLLNDLDSETLLSIFWEV